MPELYYSGVIAAGFSGHSAIVQELNFKKMYSKLFKDDLNHVPWDFFFGMGEEAGRVECFQRHVHDRDR